MTGAFIRIDDVVKRFGAVTAIDHVSLEIERGEFFSLLGPSGCGKTTLLRIVGGFGFPDSGTVSIEGEDVSDMPPNRRPTNMVFQSYAIFPHLNVHDNIAYGLRSEGIAANEREARVKAALSMIKLDGYGQRGAHELSGGERQRVALARALVKRPKVLLLDEPLGALDKRLRDAMQIELRQLQREVGITFIFVTHDQEEALSMSDRIAVMEKGRILQVADPKTLYEQPTSRAVAEFIGNMNFFPGRVAAGGVETRALGRITAASRPELALTEGAAIVAAVRPEKLTLMRERANGPCVAGRVIGAAYFGERYQYQVAVEGVDKPVMVASQNRSAHDSSGFKPGDSVYVGWTPETMVVLPAG